MIRLFKFLLKFLGATIALLLIAIILLLAFVDLNDYKPQIADLVKSTTGRTLTIEGDISLTFFPWFGLDLGEVSLGNASGFEQSTFAQIDQTRVLVKLLSLLKEQVEIDKVLVEGIEVNLTRKADGTTNWDDLLALMGEEKPKEETAPPFEAFKIEGLELRQAKIVWEDQESGARYVLSDININVSAIDINLATSALKEPVTIQMGTALDISGPTTLTGQIDFNTQITFNPENQQYRIEPLQLTATVKGEKMPSGEQTLSINTQSLEIDLKEQTLTLVGLVAKIMEARLKIDAKVQHFQTHPIFSGQLQLQELKPQELLKQLNIEALPSDKILKTVALETQIQGNASEINIMNFDLQVDDNHLKIPQLNLDLDEETLNLESLSLQAFGLNLNGQANVTQLFKQPSVNGQIALVPFNPRQVLKRIEKLELLSTVPTLPDKTQFPLQTAAFETQFQVHEATQISVKNLQMRLDEFYFKTPQIDIDLNQQTLNANQLLLQAFGIINLNSQVKIINLLSPQLSAKGQVAIVPFNPRILIKHLEQSERVPPQSLPEEKQLPLKTASFNTQFEVNQGKKMRVKNLRLRLDDNQFKLPRLDVDLERETLNIPTFSLQALGIITLKGQVKAQKILSKMRAQVELNLKPFNPQKVLKRLGQGPLDLPPPLTLTHAAFQTHFSLTPKQVKVSNLRVMVDKTELQSQKIKLNLARDTLTLGNLKFKVFGQTYLNGNFSAKQLSSKPKFQGSLKINTFDPRKLLKRLGQPLPETDDPNVLKRFALETQLKGSLSQVQLEPIKIRLDDTRLKGYFKVHHFEQPAIAFLLNVNDIDIDRYLPVEKPEESPPPPSNEAVSLPLKMLRSLDINGALKVEQLKAMGISLNNIEFDVAAQKGEFKLTPKGN